LEPASFLQIRPIIDKGQPNFLHLKAFGDKGPIIFTDKAFFIDKGLTRQLKEVNEKTKT